MDVSLWFMETLFSLLRIFCLTAMKIIICAHSALKINDGSRRRLVLVVRIEKDEQHQSFRIWLFCATCNLPTCQMCWHCLPFTYLLHFFFFLVAQIYFSHFVNWLAGYHVHKTLEVSSVLFSPYGSTALVDLDLLPLLGSSSTLGRTPLDEWSANRRDLCLTTHNIHKRQTSMTPAGFEPIIPTSERP